MTRKRRRNPGRAGRGTPEQREAVVEEYRGAVARFQRSAFWNLRVQIANVTIAFGFLAAMAVLAGGADGARLAPTLANVIGGVCGFGVYFSRPYPVLTRWLLIAAVTLTVLGIAGLVLVVGSGK